MYKYLNIIRRIKPRGWLVIGSLFFIIYIGVVYFTGEKASTTSKVLIDIETETSEGEDYTYFVMVPTFNEESINQPIHEWIYHQKDEFLETIESNREYREEDASAFRSHLNISADIEAISDRLYNVILESQQYTGGANGMIIMQGFTVDVEEKKLLSIEDVLKDEKKTFEHLYSIVNEKLQEDESINMFLFEDDLEETMEQWKDLDWTMNHQNLTFYFDKYEVAAGAAGTIEVELPLEEVRSIFTEHISQIIHIPEYEEFEEEHLSSNNMQEKESTVDEESAHRKIDMNEIDPDGKYVALTFDDGPSAGTTPEVLKILEEYEAKATFFMLASQANYYPEIARMVADKGHEIANHTVNHLDLTVIDEVQAQNEIDEARQIIYDVTGQEPNLFRPPYGAYNDSIISHSTAHGDTVVLWSVDSEDWKSKNAASIHTTILETVTTGSVVLMHDIHEATADALPSLLETLIEEGYQFVTVSQLMELDGDENKGIFFGVHR